MPTPVLNYISIQDRPEAKRNTFKNNGYCQGKVFAIRGASIASNKIFLIYLMQGMKLERKPAPLKHPSAIRIIIESWLNTNYERMFRSVRLISISTTQVPPAI